MLRRISWTIFLLIVGFSLSACSSSNNTSTAGGNNPGAPRPPDAQAPTAPASLMASATEASLINLSWTASTDNVGVTGYKIYRGGAFLRTVTTTAALDTGLTATTTYCYNVSAIDAANNESAQSAETCAVTPETGGLDNWHWRGALQPQDTATAVAYGNNAFVVVGNKGIILTSSDGVVWTPGSSGTSNSLLGVTYGNNRFIAVGDGIILTSSDGVTWALKTLAAGTVLTSVIYSKNTFAAVGMGSGLAYDGATPGCILEGVAYGNDAFVTVGHYLMDADYVIRTSPDGTTWTGNTWGAYQTLMDVVYGLDAFVAVGISVRDGLGFILTSPDGITWTPRTSGVSALFHGVTYGNDTFAAVGSEGMILTSPDGITWTPRSSGMTSNLLGITFGNNTFVAVGADGAILQSDPVPLP